METWKFIVFSNNKYLSNYWEVSNRGRIKNANTNKILKPYKNNPNGYLYVNLLRRKKGKVIRKNATIHRLVASAFLLNPDKLHDVNHKDENKNNNNVTNLEWCTHKYNINYGNHNKKVYMTKLKIGSEENVGIRISIKGKRWNEFISIRQACKATGVSKSTLLYHFKKMHGNKVTIGKYTYEKLC